MVNGYVSVSSSIIIIIITAISYSTSSFSPAVLCALPLWPCSFHLCCVPFNWWTRDYEFTSGERAFHRPLELIITSGELELGSCNSRFPLRD